MKSFKIEKILIPIDFSETSLLAIEHAAFTAQLFKAKLVLVHVMENHWSKFNIVAPNISVESPSDIANAIETRLEDTAKDIRSKYGVESICITTKGRIDNEILSLTKEHNADLIIMGTHGTSGFVEFFVGSNAYKVVTQAECPVLSIQEHAKNLGFKNILLPIDHSDHSRQKAHQAIVLAKHFSSTIHIVGLEESSDEPVINKLKLQIDKLEEFIKNENIPTTKKIIKTSNQAKTTTKTAKEVGADLILIMTDQDENITGRLMGTYAQQIVNHSKTPVMSVQPEVGFLDSKMSLM